jgi:hypothetical protein
LVSGLSVLQLLVRSSSWGNELPQLAHSHAKGTGRVPRLRIGERPVDIQVSRDISGSLLWTDE